LRDDDIDGGTRHFSLGRKLTSALWGTEYNERAVRFYERCGFKTTGERVVWRGKPPNVRMSCDPTLSDNLSRTTRDRIADQHRFG